MNAFARELEISELSVFPVWRTRLVGIQYYRNLTAPCNANGVAIGDHCVLGMRTVVLTLDEPATYRDAASESHVLTALDKLVISSILFCALGFLVRLENRAAI